MLDYFCIFTKGGVLLWAMSFTALKGDPVNALIRTCLLEDRTGETSFAYSTPTGGAYTLKWTLNNGLGLVFVAVYQKALKLLYVEDLLDRTSRLFSTKLYKPECDAYPEFDDQFQRILRDCESKADALLLANATAKQKQVQQLSQTGMPTAAGNGKEGGEDEDDDDEEEEEEDTVVEEVAQKQKAEKEGDGNVADEASEQTTISTNTADKGKEDQSKQQAFNAALLKKLGASKRSSNATSSQTDKATAPTTTATTKKGKQARRWDDFGGGGGEEDGGNLDFTEGQAPDASLQHQDFTQQSLVDVEEDDDAYSVYGDDGDDDTNNGSNGATLSAKKATSSLLSSFVRSVSVNVMGTGALTKEDIAPALAEMKKKLMERNVAEEIAEKLKESVATSLEGQRLSSFTRVTSAVRDAVEAALVRILTPKRSIDVLREVRAAKERGKTYVVVFVGVNGVGKSTNLAKVAYWLLQNGQKVMIAACDTFRSGAVEQLKTHCARLDVPLYERGYEKDPAKVAFEAAKAAQRSGIDVLLVDTAGRMQDNEPLMRSLSNLINLNQPDLVLFVGEALVGNDAVDQLTKFNRRLADLAPGPNPHLIDGIVLTKFDTIDDKVGAALSMVYTSGAPVVFVGCGQTYVDLKKLNVKSVVHSLLK